MKADLMTSETDVSVLPPFLLDPLFVARIWGFTDLRPWYDKTFKEQPVGEVWLTGDDCKIATGALSGTTLGEAFASHPVAMLGSAGVAGDSKQSLSPLLLKVIFAKEKLSVQVHPDDRLAQKYGEPRGKTECWYALSADPGAEVAAGLRPGVTLQEIEKGVLDHSLESDLETVAVAAGDMVYVDAGTVHAIWPGSVLLETQQNCDLTYRLYDYGRPRELHVAKALEAIRLTTDAGKIAPVVLHDRTVLIEQGYFCVEKIKVEGVRAGDSMPSEDEKSAGAGTGAGLSYLFAEGGSGRLRSVVPDLFPAIDLPTRSVIAVPASSPEWLVEDLGGLELIRITPRWPETENGASQAANQ